MTDQYQDTNFDVNQLKQDFIQTLESDNVITIKNFIDNIFPGWIVDYTGTYSSDYTFLRNNWFAICKSISDMHGAQVHPQKILYVDKIFFDIKDNIQHSLLMFICEQLTRKGYVVRRNDELVKCFLCFKAIPAEDVWKVMKYKKLPVPESWTDCCYDCNSDPDNS
jgi:hypothetical protein